MSHSTFWTDERRGELHRLAVDEGLSAAKIADAIGAGCTRNMILSRAKAWGIKLQGDISPGERSKLVTERNVRAAKKNPGANRVIKRTAVAKRVTPTPGYRPSAEEDAACRAYLASIRGGVRA